MPSERPESVRPTRRCLDDLGVAVPNLGVVLARAPAATPTPTRGPEPRRPLPLVRQISWGGRRRARRTPGPSALSRRRPDHATWPPVASARRAPRRRRSRLALATGGQVAWSGRRRDRADGSGVRPARRRPPQLIWRTKGSGRRGSGRRVGVGAAAGALATTDAVAPAAQQMAGQRVERSHVEWSEAERHAGVSFRFAPLDVGSLHSLPCHLLRRRCDGVGRCESTSSGADADAPSGASPPTALDAPDQLGRTSSSRANAGAICSISTSARPCCLATCCQRETAAATSRSTSRAACCESRKYGATARASPTLAAVSLPSIAVLRYFCPGDGSGLRSKAGESRHESPRTCRKPWLRKWSSVLAISTEKTIRRHS